MKLLVSVKNAKETIAALDGGADLIDVKNPQEGALGAPSPRTLSEIVQVLEAKRPLSIALGEFPGKPSAAALAALGAAHFKPTYVKLAFLPTSPVTEIRNTLLELKLGLDIARIRGIAFVAVAYGDVLNHGSWTLKDFVNMAQEGGAVGCLVDTWAKTGHSLLNILSLRDIQEFVNRCHGEGLFCGLAGSLTFANIQTLIPLSPDIIGVRGAACRGDRVRGEVTTERVRSLKALCEMLSSYP